MITIEELINSLRYVQSEWGNDSKIVINFYEYTGDGNISIGKDGTIFISNKRRE